MVNVDRAEEAAKVLSLHKYQGYSCWGIELSYQKTFEGGQTYEQRETLNIVAVQQGISHVRLTEEEALTAVAFLEQEEQ